MIFTIISRLYLSNGRAYGTVVVRRLSVFRKSSVTDVMWLNGNLYGVGDGRPTIG